MLRAASKGLSDYVPMEDIDAGTVYPDLANLRDISAVVSQPASFSDLAVDCREDSLRCTASHKQPPNALDENIHIHDIRPAQFHLP